MVKSKFYKDEKELSQFPQVKFIASPNSTTVFSLAAPGESMKLLRVKDATLKIKITRIS